VNSHYHCIIVGAGFYGAVMAERIANDLGLPVLVIDRRLHAGGNAYSEDDPETGIPFHRYGPHIFHTSSNTVWNYVNRFTAFNSFRLKVLSTYKGNVFQMPINLSTINQFYHACFSPAEAEDFIRTEIVRDAVTQPRNLEEKAISLIGRPLYEAFVAGYTAKQWETDATLLPTAIITRLPFRFNYDDRYFDDTYEGIPVDGYSKVFDRMLDHPLIELRLGVDYSELKNAIGAETITVYTGPIDQFFDFQCGRLGWRTLDFSREVIAVKDFQGTALMNFADREIPWTRIAEYRHFHPEQAMNYPRDKTLIVKEFARSAKGDDEPYYPIRTEADLVKYNKYVELARTHSNVHFGGRLGTYRYYDMHQVIGQALSDYQQKIRPMLLATGPDL